MVGIDEVLGELEGGPLEVEDSLKRAQARDVSRVVLPSGVESAEDVVVVPQ